MAKKQNVVLRLVLSVALVFGLAPSLAFGGTEASGADAASDAAAEDASSETQAEAESYAYGDDGEASYIDDEVIVVYNEAYSSQKISTLADDGELSAFASVAQSQEIISDEDSQVIARIDLKDDVSVEEAIDTLSKDERVDYVQPNFVYHLVEGEDLVDTDSVEATNETDETAAEVDAEETEVDKADTVEGAAVTESADVDNAADSTATADVATTESADISPLTTSVNDPYAAVSADDTSTINQWWLYSVNLFEAWDVSRSNHDVTVAILDTGINFEQEDLKNNIDVENAYDAYEGKHMSESRTQEGAGHGTHVAGIVSAEANNGLEFAGASYNANILPINVFYYSSSDSEWYAKTETLVTAYQYLEGLMDDGKLSDLHVINMSLGGYGTIDSTDLALEKEIAEMNTRGVVTVCAGGNGDDYGNPRTDKSYPADFDECISVIALQSSDARATWADYNAYKDISAPGVNIFSTWIGSTTATKKASGTSMASPLVAGCLALLFAARPDISVDDAKEALYTSAIDLGDDGWDKYYGWGKVDAAAMLHTLRGANITGGADSVYTTESTQFKAELYTTQEDDPCEGGGWIWSIDKPEIATISEDGTVTGLSEGTAKITVTSKVDSTVIGTKMITVKPITIPDGITASPSDNLLKVQWLSAPVATGYEVYRATSADKDATWEKIANIAASDESVYEYADSNVSVGKVYYYKVVPYGTYKDTTIYGAQSASVAAMFKTTVMNYAGESRYDTMQDIVEMYSAEQTLMGSSCNKVIVTSGTSFPDALAAAGFAGTQDCPIVTCAQDSLSEASTSVLSEANPKYVYVLGGSAAVSEEVVDQIKELLPQAAIRRVSGDTRYETAIKIYDEGKGSWGVGAKTKTAFIASGDNSKFADSLSVSPYLYAAKSPLFLVDSNSVTGLSASVLQRIKSGGFDRVVIVGGTASVPESVEKQLKRLGITFERWAGENRYETSQVIAQHGIDEGVLSATEIGVATGLKPWDALAAGPLLGLQKNPMVLMDEGGLGAASEDGILSKNSKVIEGISFFGGTASVPQSVRDAATKAAGLESA